MIDAKLLQLKHYLETPDIHNTTKLYDYLEVSPRHVSRLLNKWEELKFITFDDSAGRKTFDNIEILIDIERELMLDMIESNDNLTSIELQQLLNLPWSEDKLKTLHQFFRTHIHEKQQFVNSSIMDYVYMIPERIHPLDLSDVVSVQVVSQVLQTLYTVDEFNKIDYQLVKYDEWQDNQLIIYLNRDIYFSDGQMLQSEHVKASLDQLIHHESYQANFHQILSIEVISDFKLIIHCKHVDESLKFYLSEAYSGIFREDHQKIIGTGPYRIEQLSNNEIILKQNLYAKRAPLIDSVSLIKNSEKYFVYDTRKYYENKIIECSCGNEYLLFNPKNKLTVAQRKFIVGEVFTVFAEMNQSNQVFKKWYYPIQTMTPPEFNKSVKVLVDEYTINVFKNVQKRLEPFNITLELIHIRHQDLLTQSLSTMDIDCIWLAETYQQVQPYKLLNLLTHCKFKDWYQDDIEIYQFLELIKDKGINKTKNESEAIHQRLVEECLFNEAFSVVRTMTLPNEFKNIQVDPHGIIAFDKIIVDKSHI
ncbi:ABC transporter substrate-binding protein [Macrococcus equi]|uniref:ABC transporter substrate-binding protein n=1 Tax=Macrococcus equi TaxID=3395462 RepID=UPI0039BE6D79